MFRKHATHLLRGRIRARRAACAIAQDELVETIRDSFGSCGEGFAQGQESGKEFRGNCVESGSGQKPV
jgi:hypothetical protein